MLRFLGATASGMIDWAVDVGRPKLDTEHYKAPVETPDKGETEQSLCPVKFETDVRSTNSGFYSDICYKSAGGGAKQSGVPFCSKICKVYNRRASEHILLCTF
jgi:hypothetical protein